MDLKKEEDLIQNLSKPLFFHRKPCISFFSFLLFIFVGDKKYT